MARDLEQEQAYRIMRTSPGSYSAEAPPATDVLGKTAGAGVMDGLFSNTVNLFGVEIPVVLLGVGAVVIVMGMSKK